MTKQIKYAELEEILLNYTKISLEQAQSFKAEQPWGDDISLIDVLYNKGLISTNDMIEACHKHLSIPLIEHPSCYAVIHYDLLKTYSLYGYLTCKKCEGEVIIVINNVNLLPELLATATHQIYLAYSGEFDTLLTKAFYKLGNAKAKYNLGFLLSSATAKDIPYIKIILIFIIVIVILSTHFLSLFHVINNIIYFTQNLLKITTFVVATTEREVEYTNLLDYYPTYSVLIPLREEALNIGTLIKTMKQLIYPKSKLDIRIVVEEDDFTTILALERAEIPDYMHIVKVPYSLPQTKPKALNYALQHVKGEYLVIYDAEDRPDPDQLLKAALHFAKTDEAYVCLQAKLNYYNSDENLLTKLFSLEYSLWFDFILSGLSKLELPVMLGGTSNHFRTKTLLEVGAYDAFNVTEDADLSIRLYLNGYKTAILDSYTLEESPITLGNWMYQRTRWIKGYIQSFLVYLRQDTFSNLSFTASASIFILTGFSSYAFFILPWMIIEIYFLNSKTLHYLLFTNGLLALSYMYGTAWTIMRSKVKTALHFSLQDLIAFTIWPFYFALHTVASYLAIFELLTKPFKWNKTKHGMSEYTNSST